MTSRVLACINTKGGVGKTTTTVFLAHAFASAGARVLVVDLDHQGNATDLLEPSGALDGESRTVFDLVAARRSSTYGGAASASRWNDYAPLVSSPGHIDVISGDPHYLDEHVMDSGLDALELALSGADSVYDIILLDCPPSTGPVVQSAMFAASEVLLITESKHLALRSFGRTIRFLTEFSEATGYEVDIIGILVTKYNNRKTEDRQKLTVLKERYPELLLPIRIPERTAVDAAHSRHIPVDALQTPQSRLVTQAYTSAALQIAQRMNGVPSSIRESLTDTVNNFPEDGGTESVA